MELSGEFIFEGSREEVWELLRDPEILATALPGTQSMNKISDTEYTGKMNVRVGPVAGLFTGKIVVSDEVPPESYTLVVEGRGAAGHGKGIGQVQLIEQDNGTTLMKYDGEFHVGGKIAGVGQRLLDTVSKSMTRQGLEAMNKALQARHAGEGEEGQVAYAPPSEAQFAAAVVKDMATEVFTPRYQTILAVAITALVTMLIGWWVVKQCQNKEA